MSIRGAALDAVRAPVELLGALSEQPPRLLDLRERHAPAPLAESADQVDQAPDVQQPLAGQERGTLRHRHPAPALASRHAARIIEARIPGGQKTADSVCVSVPETDAAPQVDVPGRSTEMGSAGQRTRRGGRSPGAAGHRQLREHVLEALAEAGGVPNVCEAIRMKCQKRDDYYPAAFDEAVEPVDSDLRLGLAIT